MTETKKSDPDFNYAATFITKTSILNIQIRILLGYRVSARSSEIDTPCEIAACNWMLVLAGMVLVVMTTTVVPHA